MESAKARDSELVLIAGELLLEAYNFRYVSSMNILLENIVMVI